MTRKPTTLALTVLAAAVTSAFAQEAQPPVTGYIDITGRSPHLTSSNAFRFEEYRDLEKGLTGGMDIRWQNNDWWNRLFGENIGRDDQSIELKGGKYGILKYSIYNEDIIHNLTFGAITPWTGVGTNNLTFSGAPSSITNTATWQPLDYNVQHRNVGGVAEVQAAADSPFYLRVGANRKDSSGVRPLGASGTSPGGPAYELQAPIDYKTTDWNGEIGYSSKRMHVALQGSVSQFEDANDFLFWRSPAIATGPNVERSTLAADNTQRRVGLNAIFKGLPFDSSLALRGTYTKLVNSPTIPTTFLTITGTQPNGVATTRQANPSEAEFRGEVVNKSFSAAYNSNWSKDWSSKIYYNWYKRDNDSSEIVFTPSSGGTCDPAIPPATVATTCSTEFFRFKKDNVGAEMYWRLNRQNKLTFGADYLKTERERIDFNESKETKLFAEWKSGMWEVADLRVKYTRLKRDSNFLEANDPDIFASQFKRFDVAPLTRDVVKFVIDGNPMPMLDLGMELNLKQNKYDDTFLGRNKDRREEISLSASYGDMKTWRVHAFGDYEHVKYDSTHWVGAVTTFPNTNTAGTAYLWSSNVHDKNWLVGVAGDWNMNDRLKLYASAIWQKGDGGVDFSAPAVANAQPITQYDDFTKKTLNVKAIYRATRTVELTFGAAYEKYDYSDIQMNDYINAVRTGVNQNFFSGAYANPNYRATIVYGTLRYYF